MISDATLTADGKPDLLYIGAEFCPVCATERWAMYVALSKFGTFSRQPGEIHSAVRDGDIPTLTFYNSTYSSPYLTFTPVETTTNQPEGNYYVSLQTPTAAQQKLWASHTDESFPWVDFGGKMELSNAQYDPTVLEGVSFADIAKDIGNNSTVIGADIDASGQGAHSDHLQHAERQQARLRLQCRRQWMSRGDAPRAGRGWWARPPASPASGSPAT